MTQLSPSLVAISDAFDAIEETLSGAISSIGPAVDADATKAGYFTDGGIIPQIQQLRDFLRPYRERLAYVRSIDGVPDTPAPTGTG